MLVASTMMCLAADPKVQVIVAESRDNLHPRFPIWEALGRARSNDASLFPSAIQITYSNTDDLISQITNCISNLSPEDFGLIIGISTTDEAIALSKIFEHGLIKNTNLLFLSPLVTGDERAFAALPFLPASLSDAKRIKMLNDLRPNKWKMMKAASIVTAGSFGAQLNDLFLTNTNLYRTIDPHTATNGLELRRFADECFERRTPLIFVALETGSVRELLKRLHSQVTFFNPYKPIICLVQEYDFSDDDRGDAIPNAYRDQFTIMIASSARINAGSDNIVDRLDDDLFYILRFLNTNSKGVPSIFSKDVRDFFSGTAANTSLLNKVTFTNSQYFDSLSRRDQEPANVKWLPGIDLASRSRTLPIEAHPHGNNFALELTMLKARVPWTDSFYLVLACWVLLLAGIILEVRKRYIYVKKRLVDIGWRVFAWLLITTFFCGLLVALCYCGTVPSDNLTLLLGLCLAPLSILPMLQTLGFTKISGLKQIVEWSSEKSEYVWDRLINTGEAHAVKDYGAGIEAEIKSEEARVVTLNNILRKEGNDDVSAFDVEQFLWKRWFESLRNINGEKNAQKIYSRFHPAIQAWNKALNAESRISYLTNALAFTNMVLASQAASLPPSQGPCLPADQAVELVP